MTQLGFSALSLLAAVSCTKGYLDKLDGREIPDYSKEIPSVVIECQSLYAGDQSIVWSGNDYIGVYCAQIGSSNQQVGASVGSIGTDNGEFFLRKQFGEGTHHYYVYYPWKDSSSPVVSGAVNPIQSQSGASQAHLASGGLLFGTAQSSGTERVQVTLGDVTGYVKFHITSSGYGDWKINSVNITNTSGVDVSGSYNFDVNGGNLAVTAGNPQLLLNVTGAPTVGSGFDAVAAALPAATNGIAFDVVVKASCDAEKNDRIFNGQHTFASDIVKAQTSVVNLNLDAMTSVVDKKYIDLSVGKGTSNCYLVTAAGENYKFPATVMGNGYTTASRSTLPTYDRFYGITPSPLNPKSAKILWQTAPGLIDDVKVIDGYVCFTTKGDPEDALSEGNVLVAAYDSEDCTGDIVWSWHLWITGADLEFNAMPYILAGNQLTQWRNGWTIMDRNLGALSNQPYTVSGDNQAVGLIYQWGRKDPFIFWDDSSVSSTTLRKTYDADGNEIPNTMLSSKSSGFQSGLGWRIVDGSTVGQGSTVANSLKYPMQLVTATSSNLYNWLSTPDNLQPVDLWGEAAGAEGHKTIYDPCPAGWRVSNGFIYYAHTSNGGTQTTVANWNSTNTDFNIQNGLYFYSGGFKTGSTNYFPVAGFIDDAGNVAERSAIVTWTSERWGNTSYLGITGRAWPTSVNPAKTATVQPTYSATRASTAPLRCVKEQ